MRLTTRQTYDRTASGKQITDDLIGALVEKAEAGYEIEGMPDRAEPLRLLAEGLRRAGGLELDPPECIEGLTEIREDVRRIAAAHGATNVRVFGSVGRGEQSASSDLDLLVDMAEGRTLFDLIALSNDLAERLGVKVDVVTEASLSPHLRDHVLDGAVAL
ncbi:MAG TPA: nucleotidyltransferase family protein [Solirubrobacterales bacterium]|nr:nucleotidyltransferase family protein [Solirubrobacterales bacterium]